MHLLKQRVLIKYDVSRHVDRDEQVRMRVQMDHLDVLHWEVFGGYGPIDVAHHLAKDTLNKVYSFFLNIHNNLS